MLRGRQKRYARAVERHPRRTVVLALPAGLGELLGGLRHACGVDAPAELDVDRIRDVEAAMGTRLPDPVLALIGAKLPFLADGLGVGLGEILAHSARARELKARGDLVVFGHGKDRGDLHGFVIGAPDERIAILRRSGRELTSYHVNEWLTARATAAGVEPEEAPPLEVRIVRAAKPMPEGRQVRHKKWGVGRLLTEEGTGPNRKIKVAFPEVGIKHLAARFLEFLDDET